MMTRLAVIYIYTCFMNREATWARLGVSSVKKGTSKDYRIVQHVVHQGYKPPSRYNDIALFGLETDVEFSKYIKPICLNSNKLLNPKTQIATGWGRTSGLLIIYFKYL